MSADENKVIVQRYVEEGFNAGNLAVIDELFAPDFVNHDPVAQQLRDLQTLKQGILAYHAAFPDIRTTIEDLVVEGDRVAKRFTMRGTQTGEFNGIPPTGRQITTEGIDILRIADGKIQEIWIAYDGLGVMQQLGMIPTPEQVEA
jgi:steroid delta-isomerase-like uncharacterized protein